MHGENTSRPARCQRAPREARVSLCQGVPVPSRRVTRLSALTSRQTSLRPLGHTTARPSRAVSRPSPKWTRMSLALR